MLDLDRARETTRIAIDSFIDRLSHLSEEDWNRQTRCPAWTVADLAAHVAWGSVTLGDALRALNPEAPAPPPAIAFDRADPGTLAAAVTDSREHLCAGFRLQTGDSLSRICHIPFGDMPGFMAIQLIACEFAIHANDLAWALGDHAALSADEITASNAILQAALPMMAMASTMATPDGTAYRLRGDGVDITLERRGGCWITGAHAKTTSFELTGAGSDLVLFIFGRVPLEHGSLAVTGDREAAAQFKLRFPGP